MGFFSSRKAEDNDGYQVAIGVSGSSGDKSVVKVIRSRFYGKKGKEREEQPTYESGTATAQALSGPSSVAVASAPSTPTTRRVGPSSLLRNYVERPLPSTPTKKASSSTPRSPNSERTPTAVPFSPSSLRNKHPTAGSSSSHVKNESANSSTSASPRKHTDTVTVTLAQRLNELAVANSEGLLTDDEYRLLRQNLFERFATSTTVPIETPLVPASPQRRPPKLGETPDRATSRPISNFQVERPTSTYSRNSITSGVANLFRKGSTRRSSSRDTSDTSSVWSATSNASNIFRLPRMLSKKSSNSSIRTSGSRTQPDTMSISSKRLGSDRGHVDGPAPFFPAPRSAAGSVRRMAMPPSSFPTKAIGQDSRLANPIYNVFEEDNLSTAADIKQEIQNVEAEAKRLMDAFNGLELTILARSQRHHIRPSLKSVDFGKAGGPESAWGADSDGRSQKFFNLADDAISMRSGTSAGTAPSVSASLARSVYSTKKGPRTKPSIPSSLGLHSNSRPGSLHRKNSSSSVTSDWRSKAAGAPPPVPALPSSLSVGHLGVVNGSAVSLVRSMNHPPMNTVPEDEKSVDATTVRMEGDGEEAENEMEEIRRRREEVNQRYEARLEYLRAKLKGAQLHEKLMRK